MYIKGLLVPLLSVQANKELVKDVLTCRPLESSVYKSHHPDDTDDPDTISMSSEDEANRMEDILGVSRRLNEPPPAEPLPPELAAPEEEGMIKVPKKDLKRAQGILKDIGWDSNCIDNFNKVFKLSADLLLIMFILLIV